MKWAMALAVMVVFGLAYLDLLREQRLALEDFTSEQTSLAQSYASAINTQLAETPDNPIAVQKFFRTLVSQGDRDATENSSTRVLLSDPSGGWISEPSGAQQIEKVAPHPEVETLLQEMREGHRGTQVIGREASASLELGARRSVAAYFPVGKRAEKSWSVAVVASAKRVRDRARASAWRLAAATGFAGLLVALFGTVLRRQERRALKLSEALRLAETTAALQRNLVRAEKLATIGTLAAGVAHEVGTPLGIISGRAEQLLGRLAEGDEAGRKGLSSILTQVEKVSTTIRQLLDFARFRPVAASVVSAAQAFRSSGELLDHRFRQNKVELIVEAPAALQAFADPGQLEQVLVNLLLNAADACPPGGRVRARASERGETICLEIADDGCGIPPENQTLVLDPFFTTKKRGQGTGLGLSIVADIVKNHGGTLEIESAVGKGTTVRICLPKGSSPEPAPGAESASS